MTILPSVPTDIEEIFRLYRLASAFQRTKKTVVVWPEFERTMVENEIAENRQWKIMSGNEIACVWAIAFEDEKIWEERNAQAALYIHRIATNPNFRGRDYVGKIVEWARTYAMANHIDFIRLDTLGNNQRLIEYYTRAGFEFLGMFDLKNTEGLPDHYHNNPACLFEIAL